MLAKLNTKKCIFGILKPVNKKKPSIIFQRSAEHYPVIDLGAKTHFSLTQLFTGFRWVSIEVDVLGENYDHKSWSEYTG